MIQNFALRNTMAAGGQLSFPRNVCGPFMTCRKNAWSRQQNKGGDLCRFDTNVREKWVFFEKT